MKKEYSLDFEIGFADSKIISYHIENDNLIVFLECWNSERLEFKFENFASLFAMNYFKIADIKEVFDSFLLEKVFSELYEEKPLEHSFRIFRFLNSNDKTALEVVCENIKITKLHHK